MINQRPEAFSMEEGGARQGYGWEVACVRDPVPRGTRNVGFRLGLEPIPPIKATPI